MARQTDEVGFHHDFPGHNGVALDECRKWTVGVNSNNEELPARISAGQRLRSAPWP